ncbi:MAG: hypothetical protein MZV63_09730 [Marinilabiliales bacterium]|nr:hypothetical protein [Marinilabiliales bacterium]
MTGDRFKLSLPGVMIGLISLFLTYSPLVVFGHIHPLTYQYTSDIINQIALILLQKDTPGMMKVLDGISMIFPLLQDRIFSITLESFEAGLNDWSVDGGSWEVGVPTSGPAGLIATKNKGTVLSGNYPSN